MAVWAHAMLARRLGVAMLSPADGSLLGSMAAAPPRAAGRDDRPGGHGVPAAQLYDQYRVEVPLFPWAGRWLFRVSCQVYNVPDDAERLGDVLADAARAATAGGAT